MSQWSLLSASSIWLDASGATALAHVATFWNDFCVDADIAVLKDKDKDKDKELFTMFTTKIIS